MMQLIVCLPNNKVEGGWSAMLRVFLERLLTGSTGFATLGVPITVDADPCLLFASLHSLLTDGDGHRQGWDWRGASSLKPCFKHWNVFKKDSEMVTERPGSVEISCCDTKLFRSWKAADLYDAAGSLAILKERIGEDGPADSQFADMGMAIGLNCNPRGMLMSPVLRL